jgi:hypothetical protein
VFERAKDSDENLNLGLVVFVGGVPFPHVIMFELRVVYNNDN